VSVQKVGHERREDGVDPTARNEQTLAAQAQKSSQQVSRQTQSGLQKVQVGITVGSALFQRLLHSHEGKACKNRRRAIHQARRFQNIVQDTFQPTWSKAQDVIQVGLETTEVTLQRRMKRTRKNLQREGRLEDNPEARQTLSA
jgi:hypothetical protein